MVSWLQKLYGVNEGGSALLKICLQIFFGLSLGVYVEKNLNTQFCNTAVEGTGELRLWEWVLVVDSSRELKWKGAFLLSRAPWERTFAPTQRIHLDSSSLLIGRCCRRTLWASCATKIAPFSVVIFCCCLVNAYPIWTILTIIKHSYLFMTEWKPIHANLGQEKMCVSASWLSIPCSNMYSIASILREAIPDQIVCFL